nr:integrase, catalytic region, zinc finger, CCHC-type, peptidase aspartic, catalytic [Tanacetum cinerariifolium]
MIQVRLKVPVRRIRTDNGSEFVNQTLRDYYEEVGISHETSVARSPQQNRVVERRNPMASEQRSSGPALNEMTPGTISSGLVRTSSPSTSYVPPSRNDWDLLFQPMFDELLNLLPSVVNQAPEVIAPIAEVILPVNADSTGLPSSTTVDQDAPSSSKTHTTTKIQSSVIPQDVRDNNLDMEVAHIRNDPLFEPKTYKEALTQSCWIEAMHEELNEFKRLEDLLFQPMFDELLNPPPSVVNQAPEVIAPIAEVIPPVNADSTGSPSSTTVDQDAPSPTHIGNDPLFGVPILKVTSVQSSSTTSPQSIVQANHPMSHHNRKWTKDHPLNNIIGQLSRPVSTRLQLHKQALFCYYDAFLTSVEPKMYKEALTQSCCIEAMHEELNEFKRLEVWELVP